MDVNGDQIINANNEGRAAFIAKSTLRQNPYGLDEPVLKESWVDGWLDEHATDTLTYFEYRVR